MLSSVGIKFNGISSPSAGGASATSDHKGQEAV